MNKKRYFRGLVLAAIIVLVVSAAVCTFLFAKRRHSDMEISLERLSDGGEYKLDGLEWGMSPEEVMERLPYGIERDAYRNEYDGIGGTVFYNAENRFTLDGQNATAVFEFQEDELAIVQYGFRLDEDYEQWFENLSEKMLQLYGEESRRGDSANEQFQSKGYIWETEQTMLQITLITGDSYQPSAVIGVARKP